MRQKPIPSLSTFQQSWSMPCCPCWAEASTRVLPRSCRGWKITRSRSCPTIDLFWGIHYWANLRSTKRLSIMPLETDLCLQSRHNPTTSPDGWEAGLGPCPLRPLQRVPHLAATKMGRGLVCLLLPSLGEGGWAVRAGWAVGVGKKEEAGATIMVGVSHLAEHPPSPATTGQACCDDSITSRAQLHLVQLPMPPAPPRTPPCKGRCWQAHCHLLPQPHRQWETSPMVPAHNQARACLNGRGTEGGSSWHEDSAMTWLHDSAMSQHSELESSLSTKLAGGSHFPVHGLCALTYFVLATNTTGKWLQ